MEFEVVKIEREEGHNVIIGMSHFIKTVEDVYEALVTAVPNIEFGFAFNEASGPRLVRKCGTDEKLIETAVKNALNIGAGHSFVLILGNVFPINVLKKLRDVQETVSFFCATANPLKVLVSVEGEQRSLVSVFDGMKPLGVEKEEDVKKRKSFLREIVKYKK